MSVASAVVERLRERGVELTVDKDNGTLVVDGPVTDADLDELTSLKEQLLVELAPDSFQPPNPRPKAKAKRTRTRRPVPAGETVDLPGAGDDAESPPDAPDPPAADDEHPPSPESRRGGLLGALERVMYGCVELRGVSSWSAPPALKRPRRISDRLAADRT